ncbi:MAG: GNAT family N-acetyltransferase [Armatimonadetes bacterium]|nr:GNAT family N-acetyltransferase [Armatimonadota bacterium]
MTSCLAFREITSLTDDLLGPWLDLYQQSFPLTEQILISRFIDTLKKKAIGQEENQIFLAALDGEGRFAAMAQYSLRPDCRAAYLVYLAVALEMRGQGAGSKVYREIIGRVAAFQPPVRMAVFEVEGPEEAASPEERDLSERRIRFYKKLGAKLLCGVSYSQTVGWLPEIKMRLMVHPFQPLTGPEAFEVAACLFGECLKQAGDITLE